MCLSNKFYVRQACLLLGIWEVRFSIVENRKISIRPLYATQICAKFRFVVFISLILALLALLLLPLFGPLVISFANFRMLCAMATSPNSIFTFGIERK